MIKVKSSDIAASAVKKEQYPELILPQIALFGRSNAGKSSLINNLINRKNLARTSAAPGKTRLLNFYRIDGIAEQGQPLRWYFVDLPGYGYAKVSKSEREQWLRIIEQFLRSEQPARACWQLVDIRHAPSPLDTAMYGILCEAGYRPLLIANKADKLSRNARARQLALIASTLGVSKSELIPFSAVSGEGRELLLEQAESFLLAAQAAASV
ncbi:MAG: ribosome biogenesis GTP-binding protein YihA/YsxC [Bacillota bacterium]|nr:ribosome biogenesis GTP-binding protein YihA/YsxC [Bacillota bacterium]